MKTIIFLLVGLLTASSSCKKDKAVPIISCPAGYNEVNFEVLDITYSCWNYSKYGIQEEFIINDDSTYKVSIGGMFRPDSLRPYNCSDSLPQIDFSKKTLLGKLADGTGCKTDFIRLVCKNEISKEVLYKIMVIETGGCLPLVTNMNFVIADKISVDYKINYEINHYEKDKK